MFRSRWRRPDVAAGTQRLMIMRFASKSILAYCGTPAAFLSARPRRCAGAPTRCWNTRVPTASSAP